jgi:hypothetical protein
MKAGLSAVIANPRQRGEAIHRHPRSETHHGLPRALAGARNDEAGRTPQPSPARGFADEQSTGVYEAGRTTQLLARHHKGLMEKPSFAGTNSNIDQTSDPRCA